MRRRLLLLLVLAACGGDELPAGPPLPEAANVTIVAHQDDDLLFMQPDVTDVVEARAGLLNIYVTAGDGGVPLHTHHGEEPDAIETAAARVDGLLAAYAQAAGLKNEWSCGWIEIAGHAAQHCRLDEAAVSLVFLAYPDGGKEGEAPRSLLHLWEGTALDATTIALRPTTYDRAGLIATVAEAIATAKPSTIRTLEVASTHGRDHSDHMLVGALAVLATAAAGSHAELLSYRGYSTQVEPATLIDPLFDRSANLVAHYDACATGCAECGLACSTISAPHAVWLRRRYAVGMRPRARGLLRAAGLCAGINPDGAPTMTPCTAASLHWELTEEGTLRSETGRCLGALPTGEMYAASCTPDPAHRFFLDGEGQLWLGTPPLPELDMSYAHLMCLGVAGGRPRAQLCGADRVARWELSPEPISAPRPVPHLPGRAVRLGDFTGDGKADLCFTDGTLRCAPGKGDGTFGPPIAIGALSVEPESLVLADVDGDGFTDACGRAPTGLVCALAAAGYAAALWSPVFARTGGADATDRSLAAADADGDGHDEICGLDTDGLRCAVHGLAGKTTVSTRWPAPGMTLWAADLDGDARADWCVAGPDGPSCGLDRDRGLTTAGMPWSFANAGVPDASPADTAAGALADIDGDHRADLCSVDGRAIVCARSQGHGFGPRTTLATLPPGGALTALWLGDLDGDHVLDACAEDGDAVTCIRN